MTKSKPNMYKIHRDLRALLNSFKNVNTSEVVSDGYKITEKVARAIFDEKRTRAHDVLNTYKLFLMSDKDNAITLRRYIETVVEDEGHQLIDYHSDLVNEDTEEAAFFLDFFPKSAAYRKYINFSDL